MISSYRLLGKLIAKPETDHNDPDCGAGHDPEHGSSSVDALFHRRAAC